MGGFCPDFYQIMKNVQQKSLLFFVCREQELKKKKVD